VTGSYTPGQLARLLGLPEPTAEQAAVISAPLVPMAVIAGAGSGKSETMAARLVWLVGNGLVRPERVLGLTFTRKAAAELGQRVRARLAGLRRAGVAVPGEGALVPGTGGDPGDGESDALLGEPVVSTYHAYAARLVADHALREALEPSLRLVTPAVAWQIAAQVVAAYAGPMDAVTWTPQTVTAAVLALAGELSEHLRQPADVRQAGEWLTAERGKLTGTVPAAVRKTLDCQRTREQLLPMVSQFAEAKAAREMIDHGDQVALAARIAARHPEVGAGERARYQVVLLDEYQDTSHAQLVLLRALFGGGHPVTAVGDPCQSIYGWRGASAGNLRRFRTDFPVPAGRGQAPGRGKAAARPAPLSVLSVSFRNTGRVLDAAAAIQAGLRAEAPDVPRLVPPPGRAGRGSVTCALLGTAADEAGWVAGRIEELLALPPGIAPDGNGWPDGRPDSVRPADIAVLCRKRAQFPGLRSAIEARGIPVEVVGLGGLLTVPEVADVVATLRVLHDPSAGPSLVRLLTGPRWRIGPRDLVALGRRARDLARELAGGEKPAGARDKAGERHQAGGRDQAVDPLDQVASDLTAEPGSLVEALDDPGDPDRYSAAGHARFVALAGELRALRAHAGRHLPDLVAEVERALGLDVEVAAQPWRDPAAARADLDAFADEAAAFSGDEEEPTLGAFLAYLTAAEVEEFGLESGRPSGADAVTLTTVHAAKGLQWSAVIVPGLAAGQKSQVFPAKPRITTRWTENPRLLPFGLRGDAGDLPALAGLSAGSLTSFADACSARELAEERRLAYVAVTRAAFWVACTGYWWGEGTSRLGPSVFLTEVREACEAGAGRVASWAPEPPADAQNPALAETPAATWPVTPGPDRLAAVREAAAMVERAMAERPAPADGAAASGSGAAAGAAAGKAGAAAGAETAAEAGADGGAAAGEAGAAGGAETAAETGADGAGLAQAERELIGAWARDTGLLLAERRERHGDAALAVPLPARLTVSSLVAMAADPAELARQIRRPMPRPPAPQARRGTAFHRWLEERFRQQRLIDPADLLGAADEPPDDADAADLGLLREQFEAGEWANRWPQDVEVPFETLIGGRPVRGRIDAVFADAPEGGYDVVDWKTGDPPAAGEQQRAVAVQLAAYRVAWSQLAGAALGQVRAAFYYVRHDLTLRPADLLDEAGLAALIDDVPLASRRQP
jgi:DNA helicase-2/ATP-dependent DNA helicase PcrA